MAGAEGIVTDLQAESDSLDDLVTGLDDWRIATPAPGWTVAHQIAHLWWTCLLYTSPSPRDRS